MTSTFDPSKTSADGLVAEIYRSEWGRLLSLLVTRSRRLDLAEDALSEAFARATDRWAKTAVPANPAGWLYTTAWRLIIGGLRAEAMRGRKAPLLATGADWAAPSPDPNLDRLGELADDRLALILLCSHPALSPESRSALALRLVIGTSTAEIARLFLVPVPTMAARLTRAKKKIVTAGIPLSIPVRDALDARLDDVCRTIYLAFTAGYTPGHGADLVRADLAGEAVELSVVLQQLVPDAGQVRALAGLLQLQHARRDARVVNGRLVTLADQNRGLWHRDEIDAGLQLTRTVPSIGGYAEELRLQALIGVEHVIAADAAETDWVAIARLYERLELLTGSPIVRLNRAVAVAEAHGPESGLALLKEIEQPLAHNHRFHAVRAALAERAGHFNIARSAYEQALQYCSNGVERTHLTQQLQKLP